MPIWAPEPAGSEAAPDAAYLGRADPFDFGGLAPGGDIEVVDYHTAGEPFRIVPAAWPPDEGGLPGWPPAGPGRPGVLDRRAWIAARRDGVRRLCVNEPRGHADMYGAWIVPSDGAGPDGDAVFGAVFFHKDGYSTACGHGTIALAAWAVESGQVPVEPDCDVAFAIDVPSGRVRVRVAVRGGRVRSVAFRNVPAWVAATGLEVVTSLGPVKADVSYGGAFYASVRAADLGLAVRPDQLDQLIAVGREIKWALNSHPAVRHPEDDRLSGMYGVIWWDDLPQASPGELAQRNVTVFADGEVDRSPCGSGTSARLALLAAAGRLAVGGETAAGGIAVGADGISAGGDANARGRAASGVEAAAGAPAAELRHLSIIDSVFAGRVLGRGPAIWTPAGAVASYLTEVEGRASQTGRATLILSPDDELGLGFQLR